MSVTFAGLRSWAKGLYPLEAAVEILVRAFGGRFADPGQPWIQPCDQAGWWWLDVTTLVDDQIGHLSGGEQRVLRIVASLAGGAPGRAKFRSSPVRNAESARNARVLADLK